MTFDSMDFELAGRASEVARNHAFTGTPLREAWADVVNAATPAIGPAVAEIALALPIDEGLATCAATYSSLLNRDNAGPARNVNGLWFGLAEMLLNETSDESMWMPYISGSEVFDPDDGDWPCSPAWFPDDRWAPNQPMETLSALRGEHEDRAWYIDVCLIEPLHMLYVAQFARTCPRSILLGTAKSRGIGCGIDSGDLHTIGTVDADGFKPMKV